MDSNRGRPGKDSDKRVEPLEHLAAQPFPSADLALLCEFGPDLGRSRTPQQLRAALRMAGFSGPLGRHVLLTSPLLRRWTGNRITLNRFEPTPRADS